MCGIDGYICPDGVTPDDIEVMNHMLRHRGPDDSGQYINDAGNVGLGHRRLSIIDLDGGHQPMCNEDGTLWITFNGEIYNFQEIRSSLSQRHLFRTNSDTEVILHLYEEKGKGCVKDLQGMFAFAIYDTRKKRLFAARDHLGQKPLYYHHDGNIFAFASEIKALLELKPELRELDHQALYEYLTIRIVTPPRSMFRRIRKLPPGHWLIFQDGRVRVESYWNLKYEPKVQMDFGELLCELEQRIESTVGRHLISDVPVGAFLSGGMDSGIVVTMMNRMLRDGFKTFSGDVPYAGFSEGPFAKMVAERCGTQHYELTIYPSLVRQLPDLIWHLDEPSDPLSVCMYCISELAHREVKVVLGGDGGDELFGGYDRYYGNLYAGYYAMLPEIIRKQLVEKLLNRMPEGFWYRSLSHQLKWIHQMSFYKNGLRYAKSLSYFYFSDRYKKSLYTEHFRKQVGMFDPEVNLTTYYNSDNAEKAIDRMLYVDCMTRMPDHPNMILDRMTMAHGLEARSPFLDHKLAEFCAALPPKVKIKGTTKRYVQVELGKKLLPPALITKKKQGFASALTYLLENEFQLLYSLFLDNSSLVRDGFLRQSAITSLLADHLAKKADHGSRLWLLCNAEVWYRMHIENQGRQALKDYLQENTS